MSSSSVDEEPKVVLEQTLLDVEEVFIYGIPPMKSSGGHRAEDWNLAKPLATCSLKVLRVDSTLELRILSSRPKPNAPPGATETYLFALCQISIAPPNKKNKHQQIAHWVEHVVDSSRYFVLRIVDKKTGREAHVGMGFRERVDATNFKMSLNEYENALRREWKANKIHSKYEDDDHDAAAANAPPSPTKENATTDLEEKRSTSPLPMSKLTLKEGEKIHIKKLGNKKTAPASPNRSKQKTANLATKSGRLLKKPPPPGSVSPASPSHKTKVVVPPDVIMPPNINVDGGKEGVGKVIPNTPGGAMSVQSEDGGGSCASSTAAVATTAGDNEHVLGDDDDDEEWGDFEGC